MEPAPYQLSQLLLPSPSSPYPGPSHGLTPDPGAPLGRFLPPSSSLHPPSYRAISHLLTSKPLLGMLPMPLWGSLLVNVFRKWM